MRPSKINRRRRLLRCATGYALRSTTQTASLLYHQSNQNPNHQSAAKHKNSDNSIVDERIGRIVFEPPSAEALPEHLKRLIDFANISADDSEVPEVIRAILLHYGLAYAHPFVDGNGRTARALFYRSLLRDRYWLAEYISISKYIRASPAGYYEAFLHAQSDEDDVTYFVLHQLKIIETALRELHDFLQLKSTEIRNVERLTHGLHDLNYRQKSLLSHALKHATARYTVNSHKNSHLVTAKTAREDLDQLAVLGLLLKRRSGRQDQYTPVAKLEATLKKLS